MDLSRFTKDELTIIADLCKTKGYQDFGDALAAQASQMFSIQMHYPPGGKERASFDTHTHVAVFHHGYWSIYMPNASITDAERWFYLSDDFGEKSDPTASQRPAAENSHGDADVQ